MLVPKVNSCNFQTKIEGQIETQETDGFLFLRKRINPLLIKKDAKMIEEFL